MNPGPMLDHCQCSDTLVNFLSLRRQIFDTGGCGPECQPYRALKIQTTCHRSVTCTTEVGPRRVLQERC